MTIIACNRYWVIRWQWLLVSLIVVCMLISLSLWQLSRANEKAQILARMVKWQQQGAVATAQLAEADVINIDGLPMDFQARWLSPNVWLLDNQIVNGQIGYDVIIAVEEIAATPTKQQAHSLEQTHLSEKKSSVVLVNLGWVAAPAQRELLPEVFIPQVLRVQGIFRTPTKGLLLGNNLEDKNGWPMRLQQVDIPSLAAYLPRPVYSGLIYQQQNSAFVLHYRSIVLPAERHRAYAVQWILLAVAAVVVSISASMRKEIMDD